MLINLPNFATISRLHRNGTPLKVNHYDLGDGIIHKIDEGRQLIFMVLEGDIYAFSDQPDAEKAIYALRECAIFIVSPESGDGEDSEA